ncbi:MoaD/ThiS family protein [Geomonas oryzae]|uniref:MoaD/ThiS family protein n=1 Tax=Geomonas oryzae TaxID=2364273 RepID=UPI00100BB401|nr:MoaD/ThiS family protein [Geomonas oryzae]
MSTKANTTVRMFGALHTVRKNRGLPSQAEVDVPEDGVSAASIAHDLDLPMEKVEAVFVNHRVYTLDHKVKPGDSVAFIPTGIPF